MKLAPGVGAREAWMKDPPAQGGGPPSRGGHHKASIEGPRIHVADARIRAGRLPAVSPIAGVTAWTGAGVHSAPECSRALRGHGWVPAIRGWPVEAGRTEDNAGEKPPHLLKLGRHEWRARRGAHRFADPLLAWSRAELRLAPSSLISWP